MSWTCVSTKLCKYFLWARWIFPLNHVSCTNTIQTSEPMFTLFWFTVNTYCLHVHIGWICTLEIRGDLNYRKFTAKGWADLQQEYWTIEWDVDPSRAEKSQNPKDEYISRSWATPTALHHDYRDQNESLSFCLVLWEDAAFRTINDTDALNIILNSSVSFSWWCFLELMLHSQGKQADGRLEMEHTRLTECRKTSCQQNSGGSVLIICDNMFQCRRQTFCHMAQNKFCGFKTLKYPSHWIYFNVNAAFSFPFILDICKSAQRYDKAKSCFPCCLSLLFKIIFACLSFQVPATSLKGNMKKNKFNMATVVFILERNWLKNRKPQIFKHNTFSFG